MATCMASPGPFKGADADPEATLELFEDYLEKMEKVYRVKSFQQTVQFNAAYLGAEEPG